MLTAHCVASHADSSVPGALASHFNAHRSHFITNNGQCYNAHIQNDSELSGVHRSWRQIDCTGLYAWVVAGPENAIEGDKLD